MSDEPTARLASSPPPLNCPFCGHEPDNFEGGVIRCANHACALHWGGEFALEDWNTRALPADAQRPDLAAVAPGWVAALRIALAREGWLWPKRTEGWEQRFENVALPVILAALQRAAGK